MVFRIHVVVGRSGTLGPDPLPADELAALVGPQVVFANADWIENVTNGAGHDALLSDARFSPVMARALVRDFGAENEPLLMFRGILDDAHSDWDALLLDLSRAIDSAGADPVFVVHAIGLAGDAPVSAGPAVDRMLALGLAATVGENIIAPEGAEITAVLRRNQKIKAVMDAIGDIAQQRALCVTGSPQSRFLGWLSRYERAGYKLDQTAGNDAINALARLFMDGEATAAAGAR